MNDIEIIKRIRSIRHCMESGNAQKFQYIISENKNCGRFPGYFGINDIALEHIEVELLEAYIRRYPIDFMENNDPADYEIPLRKLLVLSIVQRDDIAFNIADILLNCQVFNPLKGVMVDIAACSGWDEFFKYCVSNLKDPLSVTSISSILHLIDEKKYDYLDMLLTGVSQQTVIDKIVRSAHEWLLDHERPLVEYLYEIADRYIPEIKDSKNHAEDMSEFLDRAGISKMMCCDLNQSCDALVWNGDYFRTWDFMKKKGLYFKNLTNFVMSTDPCGQNSDETMAVLEEYLLPLISDNSYLNAVELSTIPRSNISAALRMLEIIGRESVYIDFTDRSFSEGRGLFYMQTPQLKLTSFIKLGLPVRTEDDLAGSKAAESLIESSETLDYVLRSKEFPDEQLERLVEMCIQSKKLESLNVVRKVIQERGSSKLKKKY